MRRFDYHYRHSSRHKYGRSLVHSFHSNLIYALHDDRSAFFTHIQMNVLILDLKLHFKCRRHCTTCLCAYVCFSREKQMKKIIILSLEMYQLQCSTRCERTKSCTAILNQRNILILKSFFYSSMSCSNLCYINLNIFSTYFANG